jgi:hypothetical protein
MLDDEWKAQRFEKAHQYALKFLKSRVKIVGRIVFMIISVPGGVPLKQLAIDANKTISSFILNLHRTKFEMRQIA